MESVNLQHPMRRIDGHTIAALLNPRPSVLVTCCDAEGNPNVLSVAWQTPLSHEPPMLGISIDMRRYSHALLEQAGQFVVNVVSADMQPAIELCGNYSGRQVNKVLMASLKLSPAHCVRPSLIGGALAHLECEVAQMLDTGDHTFFVAHVVFAQANSQCFSEAWDPQTGNVLLCLQRDRFGTWAELSSSKEESHHDNEFGS